MHILRTGTRAVFLSLSNENTSKNVGKFDSLVRKKILISTFGGAIYFRQIRFKRPESILIKYKLEIVKTQIRHISEPEPKNMSEKIGTLLYKAFFFFNFLPKFQILVLFH